MVILWILLLAGTVHGKLEFGKNNFTQSEVCQAAADYGVNLDTFSINVAHLIHDISLQDIRFFFDPNFPAENTVPTVNANLTGEPLLWRAPSNPSDFKFPGGSAVDYILKNNDDITTFRWNGVTSLEKIAHQAHMMESWMESSIEYKKLDPTKINTTEVCACLGNEVSNGIVEALKEFANLVRSPVRRAKPKQKETGRKGRRMPFIKEEGWAIEYWPEIRLGEYWPAKVYKDYLRKKRSTGGREAHGFMVWPELKDSTTWQLWKKFFMRTMNENMGKDLAMYMYCKINA